MDYDVKLPNENFVGTGVKKDCQDKGFIICNIVAYNTIDYLYDKV
jgi:hypothetical protein